MKHLIILRGLPGSGKSTFAKTLVDYRHVEADMYFVDDQGNYNFDPDQLEHAHCWCRNRVEEYMKYDNSVIVSNTFTTEREMKPYFDLALRYNYLVTCLIVENRHGNLSLHSVPDGVMQRMHSRFSVKL